LDALLWGSLAIASGNFAAAISSDKPPATATVADRKPVEVLSRSSRGSGVGTPTACDRVRLPAGDRQDESAQRTRPKAERELLAERIFRDRLIAWLRKRSAEVPAAEPAYVPSVVPRSPATAGRLIMRMQTALQPFCGFGLPLPRAKRTASSL
jgi:hypothetical protein